MERRVFVTHEDDGNLVHVQTLDANVKITYAGTRSEPVSVLRDGWECVSVCMDQALTVESFTGGVVVDGDAMALAKGMVVRTTGGDVEVMRVAGEVDATVESIAGDVLVSRSIFGVLSVCSVKGKVSAVDVDCASCSTFSGMRVDIQRCSGVKLKGPGWQTGGGSGSTYSSGSTLVQGHGASVTIVSAGKGAQAGYSNVMANVAVGRGSQAGPNNVMTNVSVKRGRKE